MNDLLPFLFLISCLLFLDSSLTSALLIILKKNLAQWLAYFPTVPDRALVAWTAWFSGPVHQPKPPNSCSMLFLAWLALLCLASSAHAAKFPRPTKPHIVLFVMDDIGWADTQLYPKLRSGCMTN